MKFIITETQLNTILDEADIARDYEFYKEAENFFEEMLYKIENERILRRVANDEHCLGITGEDVFPEYENLIIFFDDDHDYRDGFLGGFTQKNNINYIIIKVPSINYSISHQLKEKKYKIKDTFIHEFIHYLDHKRFKGKEKMKPKNNNESDYYNNPLEFNAFYQMAGGNVLAKLINNPKKLKEYRDNYKTFEEFYKWVTNEIFREDFIENLNKKNLTKLKKRLFNIYYELIKTDKVTPPSKKSY